MPNFAKMAYDGQLKEAATKPNAVKMAIDKMLNESASKPNFAKMAWDENLASGKATQNAAAMAAAKYGLLNKPAGYRADREPDASWHRPSWHNRKIETLSKEQIERDRELRELNEAKKRHRERMEKLCRGALFLFDEEFKRKKCEEDEQEYIPLLPIFHLR